MTELLWRVSTTHHDWSDGSFLRGWLDRAAALGLLGPVASRRLGADGSFEPVAGTAPSSLVGDLPPPSDEGPPTCYLEATGTDPVRWKLTLSVAPSGQARPQPSMAWLRFDASRFVERAANEALIQAFSAAHSARDTEYAFLHPAEHWKEFGDRGYARPVTIGSFFKGVFWGNFLGPGHVDEFDLGQLTDVPAPILRSDSRSILWFATETWSSAVTPAGELRLAALTARFRAALRPGSRWR